MYIFYWLVSIVTSSPELVAGGGDQVLHGLAVGCTVGALGRLDPAHLSGELEAPPGVAAGAGGGVGPGQVPGETLELGRGLGQVQVALQQAVAEGVFFK